MQGEDGTPTGIFDIRDPTVTQIEVAEKTPNQVGRIKNDEATLEMFHTNSAGVSQEFKLPMMAPSHLKELRSGANNEAQSPSKSIGASQIEDVKLPDIPEDQLGRSLQSQNNTIYSKTIVQKKENKKVNNFTSYGHNIDNADFQIADVAEEVDQNTGSPARIKPNPYANNDSPNKFNMTAGKKSLVGDGSMHDNQVEDLLNWAKDLPDVSGDDFQASGSSFFKKGIV